MEDNIIWCPDHNESESKFIIEKIKHASSCAHFSIKVNKPFFAFGRKPKLYIEELDKAEWPDNCIILIPERKYLYHKTSLTVFTPDSDVFCVPIKMFPLTLFENGYEIADFYIIKITDYMYFD